MPFPMVHIFAAHELAEPLKIDALPQFYLGILAPDAYWSRKENNPEGRKITHLAEGDEAGMRNRVLQFIHEHKNNNRKWFYTGYGIHILTDILWENLVYKPFRENYSHGKTFSDSRPTYMSDMKMIDLWLYRNCNFRNDVWALLSSAECFDTGLVTAREIEAERDLTLVWYDRKADQETGGYLYINPEKITDFIQKASVEIYRLLSPVIFAGDES